MLFLARLPRGAARSPEAAISALAGSRPACLLDWLRVVGAVHHTLGLRAVCGHGSIRVVRDFLRGGACRNAGQGNPGGQDKSDETHGRPSLGSVQPRHTAPIISKSTTGPNRWEQIKVGQAACGGWEIPGGFAAYTAGRVDGNPRRLCGIYRRGPGRYSDQHPQAADLHWAAHNTSPIASLRSSPVRRCDNYHEIVELDDSSRPTSGTQPRILVPY